MDLIDKLNQRFGNNTLFLGAEGNKRSWQTKFLHRSPRYTTQWRELALAY